jgi:hypothetical protein
VTVRERVARLEGLLERITRNAARPRPARAAAAPAAAASAPAKPSAPDSAPVVVGVPAVQPAAIGRASDVPPPSSVPSAPPDAPTVPPLGAAPAPAAAPAFVEPASPAPVASLPVEAPAAGVSSVPPWKPEPSSTVQARPSTLPPEELSDDDLVEVTTLPPAPAAAAPSSAPADDIEEPPASSSRSKVSESLDQAIASAAAHSDEIEVPIHTPPPESGPQEAVLPAGIESPRAPEFADMDGDVVRPASLGPTPEQLGETIELEGSDGPEIEIEVAGEAPPVREPERPVEELEVALPRAEMPSGTYDVAPSPPAEAPTIAAAAPSLPAEAGPEVTLRPPTPDADVARVIRASEKAPETFRELLEATLGL